MGMANISRAVSGSKKHVLTFLVVLSLLFPFFLPMKVYAFDPDSDCQSKGIYMVNLDTNTVVYERSANEKMYPASLTKIMTAIVALEHIHDLEERNSHISGLYL